MKEFTSQICTTIEQSKRLLDLGLNPQTADMALIYEEWENHWSMQTYQWEPYNEIDMDNFIPAWSLHRLIEMLPNEIPMEDYYLILGVSFNCVRYSDGGEYAEVFLGFDGTTYSCIIKCVEWLIKEGYFNKEYLKQ